MALESSRSPAVSIVAAAARLWAAPVFVTVDKRQAALAEVDGRIAKRISSQ
jgi:hypothetical protein